MTSKLAAITNIAMGKTYELSLVKTYVARWGLAQAIRELIQNSLDSTSPFIYDFRLDEETSLWTLRLDSEFSTLTPQSLLLGSTSKAEDKEAIGSFGEGYKIALLVLTRLGYDVDILNGPLLWKPRFRMSRTFEEEVLVIDEHHTGQKHTGLSFIVYGLTDIDVEQIKLSCLRMQENIGAIKTTQYGDILLDQAGKLYVGSLFICDTDLKYGYNVKPEHIQLERDRQTVSSWDLKNLTLKSWYDTKEFERIATMISEQVEDVEYSRYDAPELVKEECYKIFRKNHPGAIIASSAEDMRQKIEQGMTKTVYCGSGMYSAVSESDSYRRDVRSSYVIQKAPHLLLTEFLSKHRSEMRTPAIVAFKELIQEAKNKWILK